MYKVFKYTDGSLYSFLADHEDDTLGTNLLLKYEVGHETRIKPAAENLGLGIFVIKDKSGIFKFLIDQYYCYSSALSQMRDLRIFKVIPKDKIDADGLINYHRQVNLDLDRMYGVVRLSPAELRQTRKFVDYYKAITVTDDEITEEIIKTIERLIK